MNESLRNGTSIAFAYLNEVFLSLSPLLQPAVVAALIFYVAKGIFDSVLRAVVQLKTDKRRIEYERSVRIRERAQLVAELLSQVLGVPAKSVALSNEHRNRLNRLSFEAFLWLPEDIARQLAKALQQDPDAISQDEILIRVRTLLSGTHQLTPSDITRWDHFTELPNRGLPEGFKIGQLTITEAKVVQGTDSVAIVFSGSKSREYIKEGARVIFTFQAGEKTLTASSDHIHSLTLLRTSIRDGEPPLLTLSVFPSQAADSINRALFSNSGADISNPPAQLLTEDLPKGAIAGQVKVRRVILDTDDMPTLLKFGKTGGTVTFSQPCPTRFVFVDGGAERSLHAQRVQAITLIDRDVDQQGQELLTLKVDPPEEADRMNFILCQCTPK